MGGNPLSNIDPLGLFRGRPGRPLYRALLQTLTIASADGPLPLAADVAAIAFLAGYTGAMAVDLLLNEDYADAVEQSDFDFIVSEIQLYKPSYTYDTSTLWSPNWEDYFDLLDELYESQLGYVETAENSICAPEYAPYSEELLERARSGIEFTSSIDDILNQNDDLIDQQLENAYEDYRDEGGELTFEDWVSQGMPEAGVTPNRVRLVEQDGETFQYSMIGRNGNEITVITNQTIEGDRLILSGLHIDGAGPGTSGIRELREFARDLGRQNGVDQVVIRGGVRTTGANPGHTPREIVISVR